MKLTLEEKQIRCGVRIGDKLQIINMTDEPQYTDRVGTVTSIDDELQIHGTWGGCALCSKYGDSWKKLSSSDNA